MTQALIIEDVEEVRRMLRSLVEAGGHTVHEASCLASAREFIAEREFDFILLDLKIPLRDGDPISQENGERCLAEIRQSPKNKAAGIIVVSSIDDFDAAIDKMKKGADDYIRKPFEGKKKLHESIAEAMSKREKRLEAAQGATDGLKPFPGGELSLQQHQITLRGLQICGDNTCQQHQVLRHIALSEKPATGQEIADALWGRADERGQNAVAKAVFALRRKAAKASQAEGIHLDGNDFITNPGAAQGYSLGSKIKVASPATAKRAKAKS